MLNCVLCWARAISKWTTLLTFQYNTFCISTCLFIISLSTLIAPSAYPSATVTRSVGLVGWLAGWLVSLRLVLIHTFTRLCMHLSICLAIYRNCLSISISLCHSNEILPCAYFVLHIIDRSPAVDVEQRFRDRQTDVESKWMNQCLCVDASIIFHSLTGWITIWLCVCVCVSERVRASKYCVKLV